MMFLIVLIAVVGISGTDLIAPSLPGIAHYFQVSASTAQLSITIYLMGFAVSQLFYGPVSDKIGRKIPLLIGTSIFLLGSIGSYFAATFTQLCLMRLLQGIGAGGGMSLARVLLRDCYRDQQLALKSSHTATAIGLAPAIAPLIGGILQQYAGYQANFLLLSAASLVMVIGIIFYYRETIAQKNHQLTVIGTVKIYGSLLKNTDFLTYVVCSGFVMAAIILYANVIPFLVQLKLHLSASANGFIILLAALGITLGAIANTRLVKHYASSKLLAAGLIFLALSGVSLILSYLFLPLSVYEIIPALFMATLACGMIFPNAIALAFSTVHSHFGIAGALYGTIQILITALINLFLNLVSIQSQLVLGIMYVVLALVGLYVCAMNNRSLVASGNT